MTTTRGGVLLPFASGFAFPENLFRIFRAGTSDVRSGKADTAQRSCELVSSAVKVNVKP